KGLKKTFKITDDEAGLKQAVKEKTGVTYNETELFDAKSFDRRLAGLPQVKDSLFLMNSGDVSEPIRTFTGVYLVKVVKRVDARIPEFEEVKDKVTEVVKRDKALAAAKREAEALLRDVKEGKKLKDAASGKGFKVAETGLFSLADGVVPGAEVPSMPHRGLFDLNAGKPLYEKTISAGDKFYVMEWKSQENADISKLTSDMKESLSERLQSSKEDEKINEWISSLRKKAEIQVFEDRM
ncbi:MAG: peptidyl-prolyl cis-trans isomerase, partial [Thermodesulfobacteriota bacterium]